ncbi:hypothetical protein DID80_06160 [Candidatus Marinamargulisbacteria bacterium SCGC AAA071-K20]|nr:hypothetical protein DID80_06160 [Candidatus Marinamargulisbacteria bacterium SCGC AAA071-K20]
MVSVLSCVSYSVTSKDMVFFACATPSISTRLTAPKAPSPKLLICLASTTNALGLKVSLSQLPF